MEEATEGRRAAVKQQRLQLADLHRQLAAAQGALQQQVAKREALLLKVCHYRVHMLTLNKCSNHVTPHEYGSCASFVTQPLACSRKHEHWCRGVKRGGGGGKRGRGSCAERCQFN